MKLHVLVSAVLVSGYAVVAQADAAHTITFKNETGVACSSVKVSGGAGDASTVDDALGVGESGTAPITHCPVTFSAKCGDKEFTDEVTCEEYEKNINTVTFK